MARGCGDPGAGAGGGRWYTRARICITSWLSASSSVAHTLSNLFVCISSSWRAAVRSCFPASFQHPSGFSACVTAFYIKKSSIRL